MKKILVVDDEYDLLETICATLEMGGYQPVPAPPALPKSPTPPWSARATG